VTGSSFRENC